MRSIKLFITLLFCASFALADPKPMNINVNNLAIDDLVKITSKVLNKNILISQSIPGNVNFVSNKPIYEDDLINILIYTLEEKGFTIVDNNDILRIVRIADASRHNLPVYGETVGANFQMVTNVFEIESLNVDYVSSKVMHLISRNGRVVTDKNSNSIMITDFPDNIATIKSAIDNLSRDKKRDMVIYPLENTTAQPITNELRNIAKALFNETIETQKVDILFNPDTNSIILIGNPQNIKKLSEYIAKIDTNDSLVEHITKVIGLKNTEASNIKTLLDAVLASRVYKDQAMKPFLGVDEETNNVVMIGPKSEIGLLENLIAQLDVDRPQVYVKAQIIEVSERRTQEVGVEYGLLGGGAGSDGLISIATNLGRATKLNDDLLGLFNKGVAGIKVPDDITSVIGLKAAINLLKTNRAIDVVSEPSILAINNKESSIYVGERRSIKTGTTTTDGGNKNTNFTREDIGLTLSVKPRISNDDKVILEVKTILEDVIAGGDGDQPTTTKKEVSTSSIVNNGESVILGGLIQSRSSEVVHKIPLLGDIPILGQLFRSNDDSSDKVSLVVVLTPYIVAKSGDLAQLRVFLSELAQIEDRVLKDLELRAQQNLLSQKQEDEKRERQMQKVEKKLKKHESTQPQQPSRAQSIQNQLNMLQGR